MNETTTKLPIYRHYSADLTASIDDISSKPDYIVSMTKPQTRDDDPRKFYRLIHQITSKLIAARASEIDALVDECLEKVGLFFHVAQVALGQWEKSGELQPSLRMWGDMPAGDFLHAPPPGPDA
jgi:hypothetical protein